MNLLPCAAVFVSGLIVGSFLNCIIYRLEKGEGFLTGRSYCPQCKKKLGILDLIPIFSFLFLGGRCRYCKERISWQYPLVEIFTGLIFVLVLNFQISTTQFFFLLAVSSMLLVIFVYDLKHYLIPDKIIYSAIILALLYQGFTGWTFLLNPLYAGFLAAGFFLAIVLVSRERWMGLGDVKLGFLMGILLGWPDVLAALFLAVFTGAIIGIGLIISGKKGLKSEVPFGPFLVAGTFAALFFADELINWYFNFFSYL